MCKKFLSGLMGGGQEEPPKPPATPETNYDGKSKDAVVLGASPASPATTKLSGGLPDQRKKKMGVPGLGL